MEFSNGGCHRGAGDDTKDFGDYPVEGVKWAGQAYCRWAGGSLPTEAQWEYAHGGAQNPKAGTEIYAGE